MVSRANEDELRRRIVNGSRLSDDFRQLAALLTNAGDSRTALKVLQQALALPLDALGRAEVVTQLAWLLHERTTEVDRARMLADDGLRCLTGQPDTPQVLFVRGMLQSLLAHDRFTADAKSGTEMAREAVATFERLFSEAPDWDEEEAWLEAARLYCSLCDGQRAIPLAERFLRTHLDDRHRLDGLLVLAEAQRVAGQLREAETTAVDTLNLAKRYPEYLHNAAHLVGLVQKESGRLTEARGCFEHSLAALDTHPLLKNDPAWRKMIHGRLAETYAALGQHRKAISAWRECLRWYSNDDRARIPIVLGLADSCDATSAFAEARTCYEAVLAAPFASDEDRAQAAVSLLWSEGRSQYAGGEHEAAARTFERLLDRYRDDDSDRRNVLGWLGDCYYSVGKFTQAREWYDEIASSPRATAEEKIRARLLAERSIGRSHYEAGRYAEAAQSFERLLDDPGDDLTRCDSLLWLGACYLLMGFYASARGCYEEVWQAPGASDDQRSNARRSLAALQSRRG